MNNRKLQDAYYRFNQARSRQINAAMNKAGWRPPQEFPYSTDEKRQVLPPIDEDLERLRPLALKVILEKAQTQKDVLTKLMTLTVMCPDYPGIQQAMAALFGTGNIRRALDALDATLADEPKGSAVIRQIRSELAIYATKEG